VFEHQNFKFYDRIESGKRILYFFDSQNFVVDKFSDDGTLASKHLGAGT